ncbi:transglycosylase SLT domain-containing protein [Hallella multisaccharivorax]|uniref:transglycosylase SLT domain-containing protein n=1 Tax=Hallella multisaccharivorax TaxID=310514 RepID=UPI003611B9A6
MKFHIISIITLFALLFSASCQEKKTVEMTPWGTPLVNDSIPQNSNFGLNDIVSNGELIIATLSGPETYYDYHGHGMGLQYLLCQKYAERLGVSLRVDVCRDTAEVVRKIKAGDADIVTLQLPDTVKGVDYTRVKVDSLKHGWAVNVGNQELAKSIDAWFKKEYVAATRREESFLLSTASVRRHIFSPLLDRSKGIISRYDKYFMMYAPLARLDWRLMAAQCYQESTFDPNARSWAGACGLMQIMPSTADHVGLSRASLFSPEENIAASAKYMQELGGHFADVPAAERVWYQLASYNGGTNHVRDAMALARKHGRDPLRWGDVSEFVLKLQQPQYYNDPVVRYGYMRGMETVDYVTRIRDRWAQYRGVAGGGGVPGFISTPQRAKRGYRWYL